MEIYKKRRIRFIANLVFSILILVVMILENGSQAYPEYKENKIIKIKDVKGQGLIRLKNNEKVLEKNMAFHFDEFSYVRLNKEAKAILDVSGIISLKYIGPVLIDKPMLLPEVQKALRIQAQNYTQARAAHYRMTGFGIFILVVLVLWVLFVYLKNMALNVAYPAVILSTLVSLLLLRFSIDLFQVPFLEFNPLNLFLFNLGLIALSWILFDRNMFIPEVMKIKSRTTDLLLEAEHLFKQKKYREGLEKFKEALKTDPERYDIEKLIKILEHKFKDIMQ